MRTLAADGCELYYEISGQGPPVVFAHESAADSRQWRQQVEALSSRYRIIVYNARGYPPSDVPDDDSAYSYTKAWTDLATIVEDLADGPTHVVGLSMGAYAALMLALNKPGLVKSLFLAGCGTGSKRIPDDSLPYNMSAMADLYLKLGSPAIAEQMNSSDEPGRAGFKRRDPAGWKAWIDDLATHSAEGRARTMRNCQGLRPSLYQFEQAFSVLEIPTMLALGDEDAGCIEVNLFLRSVLPNAGLWMVPHCGHAINLEAPQLFNQMLANFVESVESGGRYAAGTSASTAG